MLEINSRTPECSETTLKNVCQQALAILHSLTREGCDALEEKKSAEYFHKFHIILFIFHLFGGNTH